MRYVLVLLAGLIAWAEPICAQQTKPAPSTATPPVSEELKQRELRCLATAIYFEAHRWSLQGQIAVGQVIMNRVRSPAFPNTICGVVYEGQLSPSCEFHFACDGRSDIIKADDPLWVLAQKLARQITAGEVWLPDVGYATSLKDARVAVFAPQPSSSPEPPKAETVATGTVVTADSGDDWVDCQGSDLDGCSAVIAEGKESKVKLAMAYAYRGGAYFGKNYYDLAIADYDQAIRLQPDFAIAYNGRGLAYATTGDRARAIADFDHAIRLQPDLAAAYFNRGTVYDAKGDHDRAITDFDHAIRLKPDEAEVYANRGNAYRVKGDYARAIADFGQAIRLEPDAALTYTYRGLAYAVTGDRERAISDFRTSLSSTSGDPTDKWAHDTAKQKLAELETKRPVSWDDFPLVVEAPKPENMPTFPLVGEAPKPENTPTTNVLVQPQLPLDQGKRIALVIGNSQYRHIPRLDNPMSDAELMANALKSLGFKLVGDAAQLDLDKSAFDNTVQRFGNDLQGADVGLFYYAGHGVQVRGSNYLVPISANPTKDADADFQLLDAGLVLRQMEGSGTKLNIVMLDACRNNPFGSRGLRSGSGGLAQMQGAEGTLISYATQPGNVAQDGNDGHSPYTRALAEVIRKPGLDVFQTFNQVGLAVKKATDGAQQPWLSISPIEGDFYFAGK